MANTSDLGFNVFALDKASKTFLAMAEKVERLSDKLEELDRQDARPEINIDTDRPLRKVRRFSETSSGILSGAMKIVSANAILMGLALVGAIAAAPAAAALAASGIVLAFGGAFAAIGIAAAAQNKEIRKEFTALKDHVVDTLKEISVPFQGTLRTIADVARDVFDSFAPELKKSFEKIAPILSVFVEQFGKAFEELKPAIEPLTDAFGAILRELGPRLKPLFENIAEALIDLAITVDDNAVEFGLLIGLILEALPGAIKLVDKLAEAMGFFIKSLPIWAATFLTIIRRMLEGMQIFVDNSLRGIEFLLTSIAALPGGMSDAAESMLGDIKNFRKGVDEDFSAAIDKLGEWEDTLANLPKKLELKGDIRDLKQKINEAKRRLRDPDLTDPERTKIRARISHLQGKVRQAKDELNSIPDETVNITALVNIPSHIGAGIGGSGGLLMAEGGRFRHGDVALVGEQGPELVRFNGSGEVIPNRESMRMIDRAGAAGGGDEIHFHGVREDVIMARLERRQRLRMAMAR